MRRVAVVAGAGVVLVTLAGAVGFEWWSLAPIGRWLRGHAVPVALATFGVLLLGTATAELRRGRRRRVVPAQRPPLSWWAILIGAVLVGTVSWAATAWLLTEASKATDPAAARVEAVKTGLGIGAGTGGVLALLLAVRRQWHQEVAAVDTVHDATERRVTELYAKAADQLGSDKAPVRLAGIYALERLAQDNVRLRQTVIDLLGAYLRMPFTPPSAAAEPGTHPTPPPATGPDPRQEREVRLTAQRGIALHLSPGPDPDNPADIFWSDLDLDLTGATLVDFDLSGCHLRTATFKAAVFIGDAEFLGTRFTGDAWFASATFTGSAWFESATFSGYTEFRSTEFAGFTSFRSANFAGNVDFRSVTFAAAAWFGEVTFTGHTDFRSTVFGGNAEFDVATFSGSTDFDSATFANRADFSGALLPPARYAGPETPASSWIDFSGTRFEGGVPAELTTLVPDEPPPPRSTSD
jgi:uncharacterized protein YjbI with pentapeptide repeats